MHYTPDHLDGSKIFCGPSRNEMIRRLNLAGESGPAMRPLPWSFSEIDTLYEIDDLN